MTTIKEAYFKLIEEKGFKVDPVQVSVAESYDKLRTKILADAPVPAEDSRSFMQKMLKPFAEQPVTYSDPRGLYIYGRVGRGKTFLMDLFFNNIDVPKIREHYYHFMQDVHQKMRQYQGSEDPLKLVAKE
ncbi:cell division protein ZapE, partial [Tsukamurella asaccharolytica]